jgi:hypothetical protein
MKLNLKKIMVFLIVVVAIRFLFNQSKSKEGFYNVRPTTLIDPDYFNINQDPFDYKHYRRVGDLMGVDMNCNNVTIEDLIEWIRRNNPHLLYQYVYLYDPSINIYNPRYSPRVFKELLRNLPQKHPILRIMRKCLPRQVRIA